MNTKKNIFQSKIENKEIVAKIFRNSVEFNCSSFIEFALYNEDYGYYTKKRNLTEDYITSPLTHHSFGYMIAKQIIQVSNYYKNPKHFSIIELGGSSGKLKNDILDYIKKYNKKIYKSLIYLNIDKSNDKSLLNVDFNSKYGCIISNEFFDALPFDRFKKEGGQLKEIFIQKDDDNNLIEVFKKSEKTKIFPEEFILKIPSNSRIEITNNLSKICEKISTFLDHCIMITIDYGYEDIDRLLINNPSGLIRCYRNHNMDKDILSFIGEKDITCDVNFHILNQYLSESGFKTIGHTLQQKFLQNMGIKNIFHSTKDASEKKQIISLMNPDGLGDFKVYFHQISTDDFFPEGLN